MEKYFDINKDKSSIRCKVYCNDIHKIDKIVIFYHGFGGHKDNRAAERFAGQMIAKYKKTALLTFDWPAHGKDAKKKIYLQDCDNYIKWVLEYVKENLGVEQIYAYGNSFGGYLLMKYLIEHGNPFMKVALRCPALDFYQVIHSNIMTEDDLKKIAKGKDVLVGFDRKVKIDKVMLDEIKEFDLIHRDFTEFAEDILIIHGTKDEVVSFEATEEFADRNIIEFIASENSDHRFRDPVKLDKASVDIMTFYEL